MIIILWNFSDQAFEITYGKKNSIAGKDNYSIYFSSSLTKNIFLMICSFNIYSSQVIENLIIMYLKEECILFIYKNILEI